MLSLGIATSCRHPEPQLESLRYGGIGDWNTRAGGYLALRGDGKKSPLTKSDWTFLACRMFLNGF